MLGVELVVLVFFSVIVFNVGGGRVFFFFLKGCFDLELRRLRDVQGLGVIWVGDVGGFFGVCGGGRSLCR